MEVFVFILVIIVVGLIMEEFVFCCSILGIISWYLNFWVGVVVSFLLFVFVYNDGYLLIYFFLGFFFSLEYKVIGWIWILMIIYVGMNILVVFV